MDFLNQFASSTHLELLLKLGLACVVGGSIGLERYRNGHPAGMRTFAIITLTSTFLTASLGQGVFAHLMGPDDTGASRVVQGILQGIGFIGAGVIVREGFSIKGLTSAATIWAVAGLGVLIGSGEYFLAIVSSLLTFLILAACKEFKITRRRSLAIVEISFTKGAIPDEETLHQRFAKFDFKVATLDFRGAKGTTMLIRAHVWATGHTGRARSRLAMDFMNDPGISDFSIEPVRE